MEGFLFTIFIFVIVGLLAWAIGTAFKGEAAAYFTAVSVTVGAWFVGLLLDANIDFGDPVGFLSFRTLLPTLAMGLCVLRAVMGDKEE